MVLRLHEGPDGFGAMHRPHNVHVHHQLEVGQVHLGKAFVAQDAGVVHQDVHPAPSVHRLLDHGFDRLEIGDRCAVGHGFATGCADFIDHGLRGRHRAAHAMHITAQVVDQHFGPACGQRQRVLLAQTAACACDDGHAAFEIDAHVFSL